MCALKRKTTYGIRALASIARASPRRLSVAELARSEGIPRKFLALILMDLARHGIVHGRRGRAGGYELAVDPRQLTMAEVVQSLEGPVFANVCLHPKPGRPPIRCPECPGRACCPAEVALRSADTEVRRVLSSISLFGLVHELDGTSPTESGFVTPGRERRQGGSRLR